MKMKQINLVKKVKRFRSDGGIGYDYSLFNKFYKTTWKCR